MAVTDDTLAAFGQAWPLPYHQHARVLESIIESGAAAVLVDVRFAVEREGQSLTAFGPAIALARERGIPLLFAKGEAGNGFGDLPPPLTDHQTVTGWNAGSGFYPLLVADAEGSAAASRRTAALELYLGLCAAAAMAGCPDSSDEAAFRQPLALRWGTHIDPLQDAVTDTSVCQRFGADGFSRLLQAGRTAVLSLFGATREWARQPCFYALTLGAEQLHRLDASGRELGDMLAGRAVFYGGDMRGEHDVVDVPALGLIPRRACPCHGLRQPADLWPALFPAAGGGLRAFRLRAAAVGTAGAGRLARDGRVRGDAHSFRAVASSSRRAGQPHLPGVVLILGAGAAALALDLAQRGSLFGAATLALLHGLGTAVLLLGFVTRRRLHDSFWGKLLRVVCLVIVFFALNEMLFRWPGSDWFGFVLLWLALGEATSGEADGFVATVSRNMAEMLNQADHRLRRPLRRARATVHHDQSP